MTRFISFRSGFSIAPASVFDANIGTEIGYRPLRIEAAAHAAAGTHLILAIHGFNVSQQRGVRSLTALETHLALTAGESFMGVLWPGDFWVPVVNYAFEAQDAVRCGAMLAELLNRSFADTAAISLISHSLGGRVLLECTQRLERPAREICIAAGAVDYDCFERQYAGVLSKAGRISVLASAKDTVLGTAYPAGDFLSDVFGDQDSPFGRALGLKGPRRTLPAPNLHYRIPNDQGYGHSDYFPPGDGPPGDGPPGDGPPGDGKAPDAKSRWLKSASFAARIVRGQPGTWP